MSFDRLLGNQRIKENLGRSMASGHISHFYLISGPQGSGRHTLAKLLAAAILCQGKSKPCLSCNPCRKVMEGLHPDFITVDDPEKKTVSVELVRQARADMYVQPNESDHKIYLLPRAQDMRTEAQNALLKILEEPPKYGVFILLTDNPQRLLPTVRSRCTELSLSPLDENTLRAALGKEFPNASAEDIQAAIARSGGFLGQAKEELAQGVQMTPQTAEFAAAFAGRDSLAVAKLLASMEKQKRDQLIPILEEWLYLLENSLACRSGMMAVSRSARDIGARRSPKDLMAAIDALQKAIEYAQGNISPAPSAAGLVGN